MANKSDPFALRQAHAIADTIGDLVGELAGDRNRWLAEHTSNSKDTWDRTLRHVRVIDYADVAEAAKALRITSLEIVEAAGKRLNVGGVSDADLRDELPTLSPDEVAKTDLDLASESGRDEGIEQPDAEDTAR